MIQYKYRKITEVAK